MVNYRETLLTEANKAAPGTLVEVEHEAVHIPAQGLGVNITLDSQAKGCYPESEGGWRALLRNLEELSPSWLCITLPAQEILTENGKLRMEASALSQFDRLCKWATARNVDVVLMFPKGVPEWMRFKGVAGNAPAPCDTAAYAKAIVDAMRHFIIEKGYGCLKYSTIFGEPFNEDGEEFSFETPEGVDPYEYYIKLHEAVRAGLDGEGLASVGLMGPNSADIYAHLETLKRTAGRKLDIAAPLAAIDLHAYRMRLDYMPPSQHIFTLGLSEYLELYMKKAIDHANDAGKPLFITELGCMYYGKSRYGDNRGPARHECFIAEAELILRSFNMGIDGILKWTLLFDTTELRGHYHLLELHDGAYRKRDNYHGYALMNRCLSKGSKILKTTMARQAAGLHVCATEAPDGKLNILLVNDHPTNMVDVEIRMGDGFKAGKMERWSVDNWDKGVLKGTASPVEGALRVRLTPLSLNVLTNATA